MSRPRLHLSRFIPLLLAAGLLVGLPEVPSLVSLEHLAFPAPEKFENEAFFLDQENPADFEIEVLRFDPEEPPPANIGTYVIDEETRDVMGPGGGSPIEWAQFLRQTRLPDDRLLVITHSLSWPDATELPLRALQEQVKATPHLVVGLRAELRNVPAPLAPELQNSVIPLDLPPGFEPPEIDCLAAPPSVTAPLFGISLVRGLKIEEDERGLRVPLLVRWGPHLLPSLPLASLLTATQRSPADLRVDPDGYLRLGQSGPILPLDPACATSLESTPVEPQSASKLQIYPGQAETIKIILSEDSPRLANALASQIRHALAHQPRPVKTYRRWPLALELALLVLLALLLLTRRWWLFFPVLLGLAALSLALAHWFLLLPPLVLGMAAFLTRSRGRSGRLTLPQSTRNI